ncbi:MAG: NHL repeat-containing protein [Ignavibacteriales bacterium]|nr:NHL repeat-containing protein [Ignavibacteriales bacterium]
MFSGQAGRYDDSVRTGSFKQAKMFCIDPLSNIIVYDEHTQVLLKLSAGGDTLGVYGGYGWSHYTFDRPMDVISRNSLDIYIADYGNHRIVHLDKNLNYISSLGSSEVYTGDDFIFRYPRSIALDRFGKLYVIDGENNRIVKLDDKNHLERSFGGFDAGSGRLVKPTKVRISGDDLVLVQDGNRIIAFDLLGNYHHTIGKGYFKKLESFSVEKKNIFV